MNKVTLINLFWWSPKPKSSLRKICWALSWVFIQLYFRAGRPQDWEKKRSQGLFCPCRNAACHLTSVEQSFLNKTEGLDGRVLHFTLDSLNPRRHCRSVPVGSAVWDRRFPLFHGSLSALFEEWNKTKKNRSKSLWKAFGGAMCSESNYII